MAGGLAILYLRRLVEIADDAAPLAIAAGALLGALCADLVTGLIHWACDTWGSEETPWLGAGVIQAFRQHHRDPQAIVHHDWIDVNGEGALGAATAFLLGLPIAWQLASGGHAFWYSGLCSLICVAGLANQLHQWAHVPAPPAPVRALQRLGAILSPSQHARHHRAPYTTRYCIATGWLNGSLDTIRFWRALERGIEAVTDAEARCKRERA